MSPLEFLFYAAKAFVPTVLAGTLILLSIVGVTPTMTVEEALTVLFSGVLASLGVYVVPNK